MSDSSSSLVGIAKQSVRWTIVLSALLILAGILAIVIPPAAGIAVAILISWLLVLGGIAHLAFAWHVRATGGMLWESLIGLLYLALGIYLLVRPAVALASLTLLLAGYLLAKGIVVIILAFRVRALGGSGWLFFDGAVALLLAGMIAASWPSSSEWAIGTLIGVSMLFAGFTRLQIALAAHRLVAKPA